MNCPNSFGRLWNPVLHVADYRHGTIAGFGNVPER